MEVDEDLLIPIEIKTRLAEDRVAFARSRSCFDVLFVTDFEADHERFKDCIGRRQNRVQTVHHATVLSSRNSRHGVYTLFVEANMTTVLKIILICFSYNVIEDYLQCSSWQ